MNKPTREELCLMIGLALLVVVVFGVFVAFGLTMGDVHVYELP